VLAAREKTVLEWLTLMGWHVTAGRRVDGFVASAVKRVDGVVIEVEAQSASADSVAWALLEAATVELERRGRSPKAAAA
jgi:hypothetical protein